jgi:DNA-binding protein YbaB
MPVRARVPGGQVSGELRGQTDIALSFDGDSYYRLTEPELERQLASLCRLLTVSWSRGYWAAISEIGGQIVTGESPAQTEETRRYRAERDAMCITGTSRDGRVEVTYDGGGSGWSVRIQPGTLATLTEAQFQAAAREASQDLAQTHRETIARLRRECFPPPAELPRWW